MKKYNEIARLAKISAVVAHGVVLSILFFRGIDVELLLLLALQGMMIIVLMERIDLESELSRVRHKLTESVVEYLFPGLLKRSEEMVQKEKLEAEVKKQAGKTAKALNKFFKSKNNETQNR
jgi:hypothetical protein